MKDELDFVDQDIREIFENRDSYFFGTPTLMQLCRELRKMRQLLDSEILARCKEQQTKKPPS